MNHAYFITVMIIAFLSSAGIRSLPAEISEDYDLNTEVTLSGTVVNEVIRERGPRVFSFRSNEKTYRIITGPPWYLREIGLSLKEDAAIEVTGSKLYDRKGTLYLILYSIKDEDTGKVYRFRDDDFRPLWRRARRKGR